MPYTALSHPLIANRPWILILWNAICAPKKMERMKRTIEYWCLRAPKARSARFRSAQHLWCLGCHPFPSPSSDNILQIPREATELKWIEDFQSPGDCKPSHSLEHKYVDPTEHGANEQNYWIVLICWRAPEPPQAHSGSAQAPMAVLVSIQLSFLSVFLNSGQVEISREALSIQLSFLWVLPNSGQVPNIERSHRHACSREQWDAQDSRAKVKRCVHVAKENGGGASHPKAKFGYEIATKNVCENAAVIVAEVNSCLGHRAKAKRQCCSRMRSCR